MVGFISFFFKSIFPSKEFLIKEQNNCVIGTHKKSPGIQGEMFPIDEIPGDNF